MTNVSNNTTTNDAADKIAIVGVACRFPGDITSLDDYWQVLSEGKDVVTEVGEDRFGAEFYQHPKRKEPGKSVTFSAGMLSGVENFDAAFFGISPREAEQLDPQQRLLLELSWEALENGGQVPENLSGSDCAVYVGIASTDYLNRRVDDPASMDAYTMTGNTASIASNRISYIYNLHGPSVSVDTACSSSLVAIHHACQAIRSGESSMAIAGGVNMLLHPFAFVGFSQASMLSERGRCRTFDEGGDGYVRSEGASVLFLKPLADAEADGDPIHGVIVASGINSDGRTNGITVPSANQQGALLRKVYGQTGVDVNDLVYLEAHGTGTSIGDPIETRAIGEVLGQTRDADKPLLIGSAKSNLGHMETASGMAGLLKALLTLKNQTIPASLHVENLNPNIQFDEHNLQVVTETTAIKPKEGRQLVGVNSFGFGGANAHVVVEHYQPEAESLLPSASADAEDQQSLPPLLLSAQNEAALSALAGRYADLLSEGENYSDVAWSAVQHRQQLSHGLLLHANSQKHAVQTLRLYAAGENKLKSVNSGQLVEPDARMAFVFSGNGSQWQGMGQVLLEQSAEFRAAVEAVDALLSDYADYSLLDEFAAAEADSRLHLTEVAQPMLFAFQVGVVRMLEAMGVKPAAVTGHSVGEVAAAWACGALSLEQAVRVIFERSHAQVATAGVGRMAAASLGPDAAKTKLAELELDDLVEIAGINSPNAVTLSGELDGLLALGEVLSRDNIFFRVLDLDYAFHSRHMDPIQGELLGALDDLQPVSQSSDIQFVSTVKGGVIDAHDLTAHYWWENIRKPVLFSDAVGALIDSETSLFLEIGPHAILRAYVAECLQDKGKAGEILTSGKRKQEKVERIREVADAAWLAGCQPDLSVYFPTTGHFTSIPTYPWQRERYWYPLTTDGYDLVNRRRVHPLLGYRLKDADASWENQLDTDVIPYLGDHVVDGVVVVPAAAYVEMALAASSQWYKTGSHVIEDCEIRAPIILEDNHAKTVRFKLNPDDGSFTITSRERLSDDAWNLNVVGRITGKTLKHAQDVPIGSLEVFKAQATSVRSGAEHYQLTEAVGLSYLPAFQAVEQVWMFDQAALAKLTIPLVIESGFDQHLLHPSLLDGAFQVLVDLFRDDFLAEHQAALIPVQIGKLNFFTAETQVSYLHVNIKKQSPRSVVADFILLDQQGDVVAELQRCRFRAMQFTRGTQQKAGLYEFVPWLKPLNTAGQVSPVLDLDALAAQVSDRLVGREPELHRDHHYTQVMPLFDLLATRYAWDAFSVLCDNNEAFSLVGLSEQHHIAEVQQPLFCCLLDILDENDLAESEGDQQWSLVDRCDLPEAQAIWLAILGDSPAHVPELVMMGRCGEHLVDVLRGEVVADALLSPAKSSIQQHWLDSSPDFNAINMMMVEWVKQVVVLWPANQRIRVLELGGGSGELARRLLPLLPTDRCDYVLTDPSGDLLEQAAVEFESFPFMNTLQLDADLSGDALVGLGAGIGFDLVLSGNALFDWQDPSAAMVRLHTLMKPQATLLAANMIENRFLDLTCGVEASWWAELGGDDGESEFVSRLLSTDEWDEVLESAGFTSVVHEFEPVLDVEDGAYLTVAVASERVEDMPVVIEASTDASVNVVPVVPQWLILADETGFSAEVAAYLQSAIQVQGDAVVVQSGFAVEQSYDHVVHLSGLNLEGVTELIDSSDVMGLQERRCFGTMELVQALDQQASQARLWLVTAGAVTDVVNGAGIVQPEQAPLWGLGRVLMNEHPDLNCTLIDLQELVGASQVGDWLLDEFLHADGETEVLLGNGARRVMRMQPALLANDSQSENVAPAAALDFSAPGPLKNLYWKALPEQVLQADEIEILPHAAGLNFRDVMYAMGLLSDEAVENGFAGASLGMELSGVVVRTGTDVDDFKVGDAVIGFAPACFSTRVITRTTAVAHKPASWSDAEAATVPTTFFTVYYALHYLAHLEEGDRVLIHGASGGVGLAAIQFARYRGAEVFATAGTDEKRDFVRLMGADHVMDSRSLNFSEDVMRLTGGEGVDIVLNSISGEAINKNLSILRPFGRFLELGKRDFYENSKIGLRPFRNNISYFGIDADQLLIERPALAGRLFGEMMVLFAEGVLRPLPHRVFAASRVQEAFRYMQQSRQIGKVIVSFDGETVLPEITESKSETLTLQADASYLVTGGLSGFGLRTAQWLAEKGAKTLILMGRSGAATEDAKQGVADLEAAGVQVAVYACDVSDQVAIQKAFVDIDSSLPPLRGVVHAAMVLDDAIVRNLTTERFRKVLAPKMLGAWNLHQLTVNMKLDFFAMYSSITTYLGNPGQANYVAANMYLESLANLRQSQQLPAVFAAWGPLDDTGYLAREQETKDALQSRLGGHALTSVQALEALEQLLCSDKAGATLIDMDWNVVQRVMPAARSAKYTELRRLAKGADDGEQGDDIASLIEGLSPEAVHELVADLLMAEVGEILRLPREKMAADKSVFDLGMDSLMGMELVLAIEERFGVRLPVMALTEGATINRIAEKIAGQLSGTGEIAESPTLASRAADTVRKHGEDLSEDQLNKMIGDVSNGGGKPENDVTE
uniref:Capsular polysaccharide biosynthesis fatty acid synthase WcbR n=1 Tax=uncultured Thiotrichaceae bacterium TaxID=298394 RepID=A0A6S6UI57_9GAMM|nr:MAG: Capsular polysaccharide biosynthesis fatty acid synthase WcbR [uncultured Thiotrichaceae bacterium]